MNGFQDVINSVKTKKKLLLLVLLLKTLIGYTLFIILQKIDDYRITCCIGLLKYVLLKARGEPDDDEPDVHITSAEELKKMAKEITDDDEVINDETPTSPPNLERSSTLINQQETYSNHIIEPVKSLCSPRNLNETLFNVFFQNIKF